MSLSARVLCAQVGMDDVNAAVVDHGTKPPRPGMMQAFNNNRVVQALTYVRMAQGGHISAHTRQILQMHEALQGLSIGQAV